MIKLVILALSLSGFLANAAGPKWVTSMAEARKLARQENKTILVDFSGSDWCGYCKRLQRDVFSKSEFKDYSEANLVLLKIDFPKYKTLPADQIKANQDLKNQYSVNTLPALFLITADETILMRSGFWPGSAGDFVTMLKSKIQATN